MLTVCLSSLNLMFLFQQNNICVIWTFQGYSFSRSSFFECKDADNLWGFFVYSPLVCTVIFLFETVDKSVHDPH